MTIEERIAERQKIRAEIARQTIDSQIYPIAETPLLLISESLDDYIEHRIRTDKVLEGILKDVQGNLATIAETRLGKLLTDSLN